MIAILKPICGDSYIEHVSGSITSFLDNLFSQNYIESVRFYKDRNKLFVASVDFCVHQIHIVAGSLPVSVQRQFLRFISNHLTDSLYQYCFSFSIVERISLD